MAAVSLSEAWNDAPLPTESRSVPTPTTVAAKAAAMGKTDAESKADERDRSTTSPCSPSSKKTTRYTTKS